MEVNETERYLPELHNHTTPNDRNKGGKKPEKSAWISSMEGRQEAICTRWCVNNGICEKKALKFFIWMLAVSRQIFVGTLVNC